MNLTVQDQSTNVELEPFLVLYILDPILNCFPLLLSFSYYATSLMFLPVKYNSSTLQKTLIAPRT